MFGLKSPVILDRTSDEDGMYTPNTSHTMATLTLTGLNENEDSNQISARVMRNRSRRSNFWAFRDHLPDPDQELFIEQSRNTQSFESFPELPPELRCEIWRNTYSSYSYGRLVSIDPFYTLASSYGCTYNSQRRNKDPLPVSLYLNAESRYETWRDFCIVPRGPPFGFGKPFKPLFFRPAEDTLCFNSCFIFNSRQDLQGFIPYYMPELRGFEKFRTFKAYLSDLSSKYPAHMNKVKHVMMIFRHNWIYPGSLRSLFNKNGPKGEIVEGEPSFYSAAIFHFPGLQSLHVSYSPLKEFGFRDIMEDFKAFLEENAHRFTSGVAPRIETMETTAEHMMLSH